MKGGHFYSNSPIKVPQDEQSPAGVFWRLATPRLFATKRHEKTQKGKYMKFEHINELCDLVRETSFAVHHYHRHGHVEKIYENALVHRLRKQRIDVIQQHPLNVYDEDGTLLGEFFADLFVEHELVIELKAVRTIAGEHVAQLLGYLRSARIETGLLINFGAPVLYVKKYLMTDFLS
jgi:GxxExxY protein